MDFIASQTYKTGEERRNSRLYRDIPESQFTPPEGVDGYVLTREWQDAYQPEWLYFCTNPIHTTDAYSKQEKLRSQFALGEMTAESLPPRWTGFAQPSERRHPAGECREDTPAFRCRVRTKSRCLRALCSMPVNRARSARGHKNGPDTQANQRRPEGKTLVAAFAYSFPCAAFTPQSHAPRHQSWRRIFRSAAGPPPRWGKEARARCPAAGPRASQAPSSSRRRGCRGRRTAGR